jgi:electron transfer flavoprotein beta subunit
VKIVVAHKWAANPQEATVAPDGTVDLSRAKPGVSEYDPVAIELGRQLADATGAELVGLSVGGPEVAAPMARKAALSRGLDRLVVVADPALSGARATTTGQVLAAAVREIGDVDLVLTGDSSVDEGAHLVPTVLAGYLGWPALTDVTAVRVDGEVLHVDRAVGAGSQVVEVRGPAVLATSTDAALPRVPGMKDILSAGKKPVEELPLPVLTPAGDLQVSGTSRPHLATRKHHLIDAADPAAAAAELVAALRADGRL